MTKAIIIVNEVFSQSHIRTRKGGICRARGSLWDQPSLGLTSVFSPTLF